MIEKWRNSPFNAVEREADQGYDGHRPPAHLVHQTEGEDAAVECQHLFLVDLLTYGDWCQSIHSRPLAPPLLFRETHKANKTTHLIVSICPYASIMPFNCPFSMADCGALNAPFLAPLLIYLSTTNPNSSAMPTPSPSWPSRPSGTSMRYSG